MAGEFGCGVEQMKIEDLTKEIVRLAKDGTVLLGPPVWQPSDGSSSKTWYFITVISGKSLEGHLLRVDIDEPNERNRVLGAFSKHRGIVVISFDSELKQAKMALQLWPSAKLKRIVDNWQKDNAIQ
jgi:hypothetical protein